VVSALCLAVLHLLNKENGDRRNTDLRLRVAEGVPAGSDAAVPAASPTSAP